MLGALGGSRVEKPNIKAGEHYWDIELNKWIEIIGVDKSGCYTSDSDWYHFEKWDNSSEEFRFSKRKTKKSFIYFETGGTYEEEQKYEFDEYIVFKADKNVLGTGKRVEVGDILLKSYGSFGVVSLGKNNFEVTFDSEWVRKHVKKVER